MADHEKLKQLGSSFAEAFKNTSEKYNLNSSERLVVAANATSIVLEEIEKIGFEKNGISALEMFCTQVFNEKLHAKLSLKN